MPALPSVAKVLRADFFQSIGSDLTGRDRIFLAFTGVGPTVADLNTLIATISGSWNTNISPLQDTSITLQSIQLTDLTSATGAQSSGGVARVGTRAGNFLGAGSAAVVKFRIARRYRGGHARFYLSGGTAQDLTNKQAWTTTFANLVATNFASFISTLVTAPPTNLGTLTHVNVSYFTGFSNKTFPSGRVRPVPTLRGVPLQDPVVSYSTNPKLGSQRRRNLQSP